MAEQDKNSNEDIKKQRSQLFKEKYPDVFRGENDPPREARPGFQSLDQMLMGIVKQAGGNTVSQNPAKPKQETRIDECTCRTCDNKFEGEVISYNYVDPPKELWASECPSCHKARLQRESEELEKKRETHRIPLREKWRKECGMPAHLLLKTFDNWDRRYQKETFWIATEWAKGFNLDSPRGYRSLIFYSDNPGVGKGHLMSGIVNHLIQFWKGVPRLMKCPIRFESGPSLVRRIRATYHIRPDDQHHEREDEVYNSLAGVPLLLLDDVGKEKPSDFTRETYWYIIDERVKAGLPVIISSRMPIEGSNSLLQLMGKDTVDRLFGMTGGVIEEMTGKSYRRMHSIP